MMILMYFEANIEERGLKSSFEGRNEAQKLDLRLNMRSNEIYLPI
jgi:hypothetical protein